MKKVLPIILAVVLTAAIAVSGTVAYLTQDLDEKTNVFSVGNIDVELDEDVDVIGEGGNVTSGDDGADYTTVMPGDFLKKEVTVKNTGDNPAYVAVTVTLNNALKINNAIDEFYEAKGYTPEEIQAIYDEVFAGWGLNYTKDTDGDGTDDADMRLTITGDDMPEHVMQVDSVKTITDYWQQYADNWFIDTDAAGAFDGYYTTGMDKYELRYTYYLYLEPDEESTLFEGLTVPAEFNADQLAMFEGLEINVEGAAIQADNIPVDSQFVGQEYSEAKTAFAILAGKVVDSAIEGTLANPENIQEILDNAKSGDVIVLEAGEYDDLVVKCHGITIKGSNGAVVGTVNMNGYDNIVVDGVTFDAAKAKMTYKGKNSGKSEAGVYGNISGSTYGCTNGATDITIMNCTFTGEFTEGVYAPIAFNEQSRANRAADITVENCNFQCDAGYYLYLAYINAGDIIVNGNTFGGGEYSCAYTMYLGTNQSDVALTNNKINNWTDTVIFSSRNGSHVIDFKITGNTFSRDAFGTNEYLLYLKTNSYNASNCTVDLSGNTYAGGISSFTDATAPVVKP